VRPVLHFECTLNSQSPYYGAAPFTTDWWDSVARQAPGPYASGHTGSFSSVQYSSMGCLPYETVVTSNWQRQDIQLNTSSCCGPMQSDDRRAPIARACHRQPYPNYWGTVCHPTAGVTPTTTGNVQNSGQAATVTSLTAKGPGSLPGTRSCDEASPMDWGRSPVGNQPPRIPDYYLRGTEACSTLQLTGKMPLLNSLRSFTLPVCHTQCHTVSVFGELYSTPARRVTRCCTTRTTSRALLNSQVGCK